ncbi:hypothetical protein PR202_ga15074 [Eleusine coracana subsp. coracana]|uniref:Protein kinase domain-containing protein n=1 Tax=Eleusine coracana subsp. coracana TaxID=191504 RepID=A0AAV5CJ76_ELECO|nr:hypothetical protein PR202_ga15074 [Eleusine coracana subsp. coracana]
MLPSTIHACVFFTSLLTLATSSHSAEAVYTDDTRTRLLAEADDDRMALLCVKSKLSDPTEALASWSSNISTNICSWHGVTCNNTRQPSRVTELNLEGSQLGGIISPCMANLTFLEMVHLPNNRLTGQIPPELGDLQTLRYLNLSSNSLNGNIPSSLGNIQSITYVDLANNRLTGQLPESLANSSSLQVLKLRQNNLGGEIPTVIFSSSTLVRIDLQQNNFNGSIPKVPKIMLTLQYLNLISNSFSGSIPPSLGNISSLLYLYLEDNNLVGGIPESLGHIRALPALALAANRLSGQVPLSLYNTSTLIYLDLRHNLLVGRLPGNLPSSIGSLSSKLDTLWLSLNRISGTIPEEIGNLKILTVLLMHDNQFTGNIPSSIGTLVLLACFFAVLLKRKRQQSSSWDFREQIKVSYEDIAKATNWFSSTNLVGSGSFGTVYKGTMAFDTNPVAIKVFNLNSHGASRSFSAECEALRSIRHRNLLKIITSCSTIDSTGTEFKALIFEYMPNGNLDMWLHPQTRTVHGSAAKLHHPVSKNRDLLLHLEWGKFTLRFHNKEHNLKLSSAPAFFRKIAVMCWFLFAIESAPDDAVSACADAAATAALPFAPRWPLDTPEPPPGLAAPLES